MIEYLKNNWIKLALKFNPDIKLAEDMWLEIQDNYSQKSRHYHNLSHIYKLLIQADELKQKIVDSESLHFAIWYHDIIYNPIKKDNEEQSAVFAKKCLKSLRIEEKMTVLVEKLIISTKTHQVLLTENNDNAYFLDMDLSILGTNWNTYLNYLKSIRKEYAIFPNFMYKTGRKKALNHFLDRETIFFTEYFQSKFEAQARQNIKKEINLL